MSEDFDAEKAAKEAIATSPEVTEGVTFAPDSEESQSVQEVLGGEIEGVDYIPDQRNGRLLALALQQWDKNKRLEKAQIDAAEEIGGEGFGAINAAPLPRGVKIMITGVLLLLSIVPLAGEIFVSLNEGKKNDE
jgi:hypothetical protein